MDPENTNTAVADEAEIPAVVQTPAITEADVSGGDRSATVTFSQEDIDRLASVRAAQEIDRRENITEIGKRFNLPEADIKSAIKGSVSVDDFKRSTLDKLATMNQPFAQAKAEARDKPAQGSRVYTLETWADSAKRALGDRGKSLIVPDYSRQPDIQREYIGGDSNQFHRSMSGSVTLIDVAKLDAGIGAPVIDEVILQAKEVSVFPVDIIAGSTVKLSVMTGTPDVGFRHANEGRTPKTAEFESRLYETQVIEEPIQVDIQGVLNASRDPGRVLFNQAKGVARAVLSHIGVQTWYGGTAQSGADTKAAPGIIAQASTASTHYVDASGGSAKSSVWFLQLGVESCDHVYGNDTTLNFGSEWMEETVEDADGGKLRALVNFITGRVAPRLANKNAAVRIKNLAASTQILSDALMYQALEKCETLGMTPNAIFMNPRSHYQLRSGRTATTVNGQPAPLPMDWNGIPIYSTTNISIAETV